MKNLILILVSFIGLCGFSFSQEITQTVKGQIIDQITLEPLVGANIVLLDSNPLKGSMTNLDGEFIIQNVPIGRQSLKVSMLGYETYVIHNVLVGSGKEIVLDISLKATTSELDEIVIVSQSKRDKPINILATLSSRKFSVEENQRFAGGLDDPARLVSSFPGVAAPAINSNGIVVRGNSPSGLLWRIEGVEIPSPNHFADLEIAGAGALTVLSNQVLANSDFYTGAFPAEYGNATSGVFDMKLRSGNTSNREYTLQGGLLGLDFATEGPFQKGKDATYLMNYRYSTLGLIAAFIPDDAGILKYQDMSFKMKFPLENFGTLSIWGIAGYDSVDTEAQPVDEWESVDDREDSQLTQYLFASGLNHKIRLGSKSLLNSTLAFTGNGLTFKEQYLDENLVSNPISDAAKNNNKITFQSFLNTHLGTSHFNRTGFYINRLAYDLDINDSETPQSSIANLVDEKGSAMLYQFFSQSKFQLTERLNLNTGLHGQYFQLNNSFSLEPRIALKYQLKSNQSLAIAYGSHSKVEALPIYFVNINNMQPNKDLKLMKSNHFVLSYEYMMNDNLKLSIEPYYQHLKSVPVSPISYISTINTENILFFNEALVSSGTGRNIGIDVSLDRYLKNGFYYMLSASVFDSKYTANDDLERNTRFNKNYVFNALVGKEWEVGRGKNNLLSTNIRLNYLGGNRIESIDMQASINQQDVVYGETNGEFSFAKKHKDLPITSFSVSYRKNKPKHSSVWSLQVMNSSQAEEHDKDIFNLNTGTIETKYSKTVIPNFSYKIEF